MFTNNNMENEDMHLKSTFAIFKLAQFTMVTSTSAITTTHLKKVKVIACSAMHAVRLRTQWLCTRAFYTVPTRYTVTNLFIRTPNSFYMISNLSKCEFIRL